MSGISVAGVLCQANQMYVLGVGWRHLGVESQTWWDFVCRRYRVTGSDKVWQESWCGGTGDVGLNEMNASQLYLTVVVGEIMVSAVGGWASQ